jgi:hypothetical protein
MSFVSNDGKFKLYTVLNGLIFPTPTQPRISFERAIQKIYNSNLGHSKFAVKPMFIIKVPKYFCLRRKLYISINFKLKIYFKMIS